MAALNEVRLTIKSKNRKVGPMPVPTKVRGRNGGFYLTLEGAG